MLQRNALTVVLISIALLSLATGCDSPLIPLAYSVTYDGNDSSGGTVPIDGERYHAGDLITVAGASDLTRLEHTFQGWNLVADGSGESFQPGDSLTMGDADVTLFAQWLPVPAYGVTYDGNGPISGPLPEDGNAYPPGETVTIVGSGLMNREGFTFVSWNTAADGSGTEFVPWDTFVISDTDVVLYARWAVVKDTAFVSTWNTENTTAGSSSAVQVALPLDNTVKYDFVVDWGDGSESWIENVNDSARIHTYSSPGTYQITVWGVLEGLQFADFGDKHKILEIQEWGPFRFGNSGSNFHGASNLTITATDVPNFGDTVNLEYAFAGCTSLQSVPGLDSWNLTGVRTMEGMFSEAVLFNQDIGGWNVSSVTNMDSMFAQAGSFDQDIGSWNISAVTSMHNMFQDVALASGNYDALLLGWAARPVLQSGVSFSGGVSQYSGAAAAARQSLIDTYEWVITDGGLQ